jgi:putative ABC transport system ATP-binding protein
MQVTIRDLLPSYFNENAAQASGIWRKELTFERGERIKIVAPSGTGKSSLINFLYGTRTNYSGEIRYAGKNLREYSGEHLARLRKDHISIVFQDLRLFGEQSAQQNLEIKRQLNPFHPAEKIPEMAGRLGIAERLSFTCNTCSYGEQQRIAIIRALLQPFEVLLLDEPFSHLDQANAERAMDLMLDEAGARNATIIFVDLERFDPFPHTRLFHL